MRTQVAIIGAGPSGLLLSQLLHLAGIDCVVLEQRSGDYVLSRIRAGVLEQGMVDMIDRAGVGARMHKEGLLHDGFTMAVGDTRLRMDLKGLTGSSVMVYGQTEVTRDLMDAHAARDAKVIYEAEAVTPLDFDTDHPRVTYVKDGVTHEIACDFICGCDGFHGVCRKSVPEGAITEFEKVYPVGWLGILSHVRPVSHELIYANHDRGFALASMRSHTLSRYYIQVPLDSPVEAWSDEAIWDELKIRLGEEAAASMETGPSIEKSIAPLRSFVVEPLRFGRMMLAGDAGHIVPPTGAKGLNLAASDIHYLSTGLIEYYADKSAAGIDAYSQKALARIWKAERFSWWMTMLLHKFPDLGAFNAKMQQADMDYLASSTAAQTSLAENYVGLPF
ncbi:4-hydroxybenzoate 3-monooxygenase [Polymorphum gilvum]|uniref:p-hydroxybenzoate hydroxylase transcriptional activator n=1 Tax=Polymorphum gilvum (strain LMG 25793 / CGMCC 1.9160 / SL003B-26A1) TaxID=991905 RepID=F2J586_POLGS|nr:4-hydroxybenzoate 3-monooxygenase [Polymorphum gilvum]ADZ71145.1 p-hydroxybenzoate hydroxylase transcriptional activator [Polymorphum gilvum SL003B-26A1]